MKILNHLEELKNIKKEIEKELKLKLQKELKNLKDITEILKTGKKLN